MIDPLSLQSAWLAHSAEGLLAFDRDCRYTLWNPVMERISGLTADQVIGRPAFELFPFLKESGEDYYFREALAGRCAVAADRAYSIPETGHQGVFEGRYVPLRSETGEVVGGLGIIRDITADKAVERQREEILRRNRRERLLATAGELLGSSLDYETTLRQVARLALPHLADFCLVDVVEGDAIVRIATAHVDPACEVVLHELQQRFPPHWNSPAPAARAIRTGEAELLSEVDAEIITAYTVDAGHAELIRRLNTCSHLAIPLVARGEKLGAISLGRSGDSPRFTPEDRILAAELARRAAVAIDHARLYRAAQAEIAERLRAEEQLKLHSRVLESMYEGVSVTDEAGFIVYTNPAEDTMFGYERGELLGRHVTLQNAYPPEENQRIVDQVIETLKTSGAWTGEWLNRKKDGTDFITRAHITGLSIGEKRYWVCVQEDITAQKRAEDARRESEALAQQVIANSQDCIHTLDLAGRLLSISDCGLRLLEIDDAAAVIGTPWLDFWTEDREAARAAFETARRGGVGQMVGFCPTFRGQPRWWDVVISPIRDAEGKVERLLCIARDLTQTRRDEAELREQAQIIETVNRVGQLLAGELDLQKLLQALTDAATEITTAQFGSFFYNAINERGESYLLYTLSGTPRESFEGFPMPRNTALFGPTFRGEGIVRLADVLADERHGQNPPYHGFPRGHLPVRSYLAAPVKSRTGEVLGGLFFGHAQTGVFTERHERVLSGIAAQAAIAIDNARLYKLARDAEYAAIERAEQLAEANRQKDDFLAMLAHELRNPLGAISNAIHVMQRATPDQPAFQRAQEIAVRQINHQTRLVDDLLDVSRIARGKIRLHLETLDLVQLVRDTAEDHRSAIERAEVSLRLELPAAPTRIFGDRVRLAQVLGNLLDNARKFTPAGGRITVRLAPNEQGEVTLAVRDTGIGIEAEILPHLFTPFSQADRTLDRSPGGLGLGLALVKGLVELHEGGTVRVTSAGPGQGAEFQITLPAVEEPSFGEGDVAPLPPSVALRVLIIEDNRDAAETMRDLLDLLGCEVDVAYSGTEGLHQAGLFQPDVVLCDIGLPGGLDGYQVARQLRSRPATATCRLVALTGYGADEDQRQSRDAGFDLHLTKPLQLEQIQQILALLPRRLPRAPD